MALGTKCTWVSITTKLSKLQPSNTHYGTCIKQYKSWNVHETSLRITFWKDLRRGRSHSIAPPRMSRTVWAAAQTIMLRNRNAWNWAPLEPQVRWILLSFSPMLARYPRKKATQGKPALSISKILVPKDNVKNMSKRSSVIVLNSYQDNAMEIEDETDSMRSSQRKHHIRSGNSRKSSCRERCMWILCFICKGMEACMHKLLWLEK